MRSCPGPAMCPYASGKRFFVLIALVALVILAMTSVAITAVIRGKDGVITGACCGAMSAAVCGVLVGAGRRLRGDTSPERRDDRVADVSPYKQKSEKEE